MAGDAGDSPLVQQRGSENQVKVGVFLRSALAAIAAEERNYRKLTDAVAANQLAFTGLSLTRYAS